MQDFYLPIESASATTHTLTNLEPRVPRMLERLSFLDGGRGLLTRLKVAGRSFHLGDGFPLAALAPGKLVDKANFLGIAVGPNTPIELAASYTSASALAGAIGTAPLPESKEAAIKNALKSGILWGQQEYTWGLGEKTQPTANTAEQLTWAVKVPRSLELDRMVMCCYRSDGNPVGIGDFKVSRFEIGGGDLFSASGNLDALLLSPDSSDEDGLIIGKSLDTDTLVEIVVDVAALGSGVTGTVQIGFFTS